MLCGSWKCSRRSGDCAGQLPEIYDGDFPAESKGCFAQTWSVGEMLRVWEKIETIEQSGEGYDDSNS